MTLLFRLTMIKRPQLAVITAPSAALDWAPGFGQPCSLSLAGASRASAVWLHARRVRALLCPARATLQTVLLADPVDAHSGEL